MAMFACIDVSKSSFCFPIELLTESIEDPEVSVTDGDGGGADETLGIYDSFKVLFVY
jgi:hypothetical protein